MSFVVEHSAQSIDFTLGSSTEIWALTTSSTSRTPDPLRRRASQGSSKSTNASYVSSPTSSTSALRGSTHKRASTISGAIVNGPLTHPLQEIPPSPSSSSSINFNSRQLIGRRKRRLRPDVLSTDFFVHDEDMDLSASNDRDLIDLRSEDRDESSDNSRERIRAGKEPEIPVIIHKVQPSDSLAGVSLKYGIPLADLRRANQLWTSDSIHLRQVLFIPVHLSNRRHDYYRGINGENGETPDSFTQPPSRADSDLIDLTTPSVSSSTVTRDLSASYTFPSSIRIRPTIGHSNTSTLQRSSDKNDFKCSNEPPIPSTATLTPSSWFSTSFLQKFPTQLTSRGPIHLYSRISADSSEVSSSNISETSSDQEHEMDVFEERSSFSKDPNGVISSECSVERRERRHRTNTSATVRRPSKDLATVSRRWDSDIDLDDPEFASYKSGNRAALMPTVPFRTEQLKPSPQMKFPVIGDK